jgi:hypothetical protein
MLRRRHLMSVLFAAVFLISGGCASGPKFSEREAKFPALAADQGRIFFYREPSPDGAFVQPDVHLNGQRVGRSCPATFFYVDRPPGNYEVSTSTEAEHKLTVSLAAGETKYVKTTLSMGLFVGQVWPSLEDNQTAVKTLDLCNPLDEK